MRVLRVFSYIVALGLIVSVGAVAAEPIKMLPSSSQQITLSYAPIVKHVAPAVVNIYTRKMVRQRVVSPLFNDPFFQQFFGGAMPQGPVRQRMEASLGSGVVIRPDGLIVTNNHVIAGADQITVVLSDRREFEAKVVTSDERSDLAVLKIDMKDGALPYLELKDSDVVDVGDLVLAIGNPFGVGQTVTNGIISALARSSVDINDLNYFIQTDAPINPGNSGGALVTMDGKLVGINSAIFSRDGGNMGIGFAIPANMVRAVVEAVETGHKTVVRPWTGIEGQEITADMAASLGLSSPSGLLVKGVHSASPAKAAGLKVGDVITAVDGKAVADLSAFRYRIATMAVGSEAKLEIMRGGKKEAMSFKLIAPPEVPVRDETMVKGNNPLAGAVIANMSPALAEETGLRGVERGVVVLKVSGGAAAGLGFRVGDVLLKINNVDVGSVKDATVALQKPAASWRLSIRRGSEVVSLMVGG
jgi:Do/DeqQ family serine protease